jgi:hypothetical protein
VLYAIFTLIALVVVLTALRRKSRARWENWAKLSDIPSPTPLQVSEVSEKDKLTTRTSAISDEQIMKNLSKAKTLRLR